MSFVGGHATVVGLVVVRAQTSLWHFLLSCPLVVGPKFIKAILGYGGAAVGEGVRMPMMAVTVQVPMRDNFKACCAMCCTKVIFELESIVQPPTECNVLPHNGLQRATMLDVPSPCRARMGGVVFIWLPTWAQQYRRGHRQVMDVYEK